MKYVIIGASAAGMEAAKTLRLEDPAASITVVCKEDQVHSRCMLHHVLGAQKQRPEINFTKETFWKDFRITFLPNTTVSAIAPGKKEVLLEGQPRLSYDRLLLATGAFAFVPPIPGLAGAKNLSVFRDLADVDKLSALAKANPKGNCIIIGSGLVGMDAAAGLGHLGIHVTIVETANRICPLQLDPTAAAAYQERFEQAGCQFRLSQTVNGAIQEENGIISGISLGSGETLPCDFVIVATGVRPNIALAKEAGLETDRGIVVDDFLRTSQTDIYAAGDVSAFAGIWSAAVEQGAIAAKNMAGGNIAYTDRYGFKNTMNFHGLATLSVGIDTSEKNDPTETVVIRESRDYYQKYILRDGFLTFALSQGQIGNMGFLQQLIKRKVPVGHVKKNIFDCSFGDFYDYDLNNGEYQWN